MPRSLPLTALQQQIFLADSLLNDSHYNNAFIFELIGNVDVTRLLKAINAANNFFEANRTRLIKNADGSVWQFIDEQGTLNACVYLDLTEKNFSTAKAKEVALLLIEERCQQKMDCFADYPTRLILIKYADSGYLFACIAHHIFSDGKAGLLFLKACSVAYNQGEEHLISLFNPSSGIGEYLDEMAKESKNKQEFANSYWLEKLADQELALPFTGNAQSLALSATASFTIGTDLLDSMRSMCKSQKTTLFLFMATSFAVLLNKYLHHQNLVLWYPVDLRPKGHADWFGCYVHEIPLVISIAAETTFIDLLRQITQSRKQDSEYQHLFHAELLKNAVDGQLDPADLISLAQTPLLVNDLQLDGMQVVCLKTVSGLPKQNLRLHFAAQKEDCKCTFYFNRALYPSFLIDQLIAHFQQLVHQLVQEPNIPLQKIDILLAEERHRQLYDWNNTKAIYPESKTLPQLFEQQVNKTPQAIAVVFENQQLTYAELNAKANQLSRTIRQRYQVVTGNEITADTLIAICTERGLNWIIGILAILKAGGAYVPIDPTYPEQKIAFILNDTGCQLMLSQSHIKIDLPRINLDQLEAYAQDDSNLNAVSGVNDLAYVIYTSGTTGKPKGVMIEQRSVVNFIFNFWSQPIADQAFRVLSLTNITFDIFGTELWASLLSSGQLILAPKNWLEDLPKLNDLIEERQINLLQVTPSVCNLLLDAKVALNNIRHIIVGGESLSAKLIDRLWHNHLDLYNYYGPTETTIWSMKKNVRSAQDADNIGKPIGNTSVYVLDETLNLVPTGMIGELYIGGLGLSRGYFKQENLTKERFIANPFIQEVIDHRCLYKTGDLVRALPDGELQYVGRYDNQLKIRGHRIELSEIEHAILMHEAISQCAIVAKKDKAGHPILVAYYMAHADIEVNILRNYLKRKLPHYMIPQFFVNLPALPLNQNGKIELSRLPEIDIHLHLTDSFVAPRNQQEQLIHDIWCEVLGLLKIGIHDNFFELGGHSISAVKVVAKAREHGIYIQVKDIFDFPTIAESQFIKKLESERFEPTVTINKSTHKPPILLVHPAFSGAEAYLRTICPFMPEDQKLILFNNYVTDKSHLTHLPETLEACATLYLNFIDKADLRSGMKLFGYSSGAVLAYEMALQLEAKGIVVTDLILLDPLFLGLVSSPENEEIEDVLCLGPMWNLVRKYKPSMQPQAKIHFFKATKKIKQGLDMLGFNLLTERVQSKKYNGLELRDESRVILQKIHCIHTEMLRPYPLRGIINHLAMTLNRNKNNSE